MTVKKTTGGQWGVFDGDLLVEGGFFSKKAAKEAAVVIEAEAAKIAAETAARVTETAVEVVEPETPAVVEVPEVVETTTAKANRRFTVGSAVDGTRYAVKGLGPVGRPVTLAGALAAELRKAPGTTAELVDRLNADGTYERVALKSATLRPFSSVAYWLKRWVKEGTAAVQIEGLVPAVVEEAVVEVAVV
jgi:hypothetical protein